MDHDRDRFLRPGMRVDSLPPVAEKMEAYKYTPLPTPTSIRILRINEKGADGLVYCSIRIVDLQDRPFYHTLSYTWGNPFPDSLFFRSNFDAHAEEYAVRKLDPIHAIACEGKLIYINRNLYDALYSIPGDAWIRRCNRRDPHNHSRTLLHSAALTGNVELVKSLICSKVDIDVLDKFGATPISYAAKYGSIEIVKLLASAGARMNTTDHEQKTALEYALEGNHTDISRYLEELNGEGGNMGPYPDVLPDGPEVWVWIDQICVDQHNIEERSSQVSIMDQIYNKSDFTLNWLGQEDQYVDTAVKTISKYDSACGSCMDSEIIPYTDQSEDVYFKAGVPYISSHDWEAVAALFLRRYFRRLWVIQENILSKVTVGYCGTTEVPWEAFCRFSKHIYDRQVELGRSSSTDFVNRNEAVHCIEEEAVAIARWKERLISHQAGMPENSTFERLLFDTWSFRSTDPRDKIFGLYGLLNGISHPRWYPDYSKPVEQVYAEATQYVIEESGDLRLLSSVIDRVLRQNRNLPSWVPDYSTPFTNMMCAIFNAAGNVPSRPAVCNQWSVLGVAGIKIDSILQVGNTTNGPGDMAMFFDPCWFELALLIPNPYHTGQARTECIWRTLLANQDATGSNPAPANYGGYFHMMLLITICIKVREAIRQIDTGISSVAAIIEAAQRVRNFMSQAPMSNLTPEEMTEEFGHPGKNLSRPDQQSVTYLFFKLHLLAMAETTPATPTIEQIEEQFQSINWKDWDEGVGPAIRLPPEGAPFYDSLRNKYGRRRLFVTGKRLIGLGSASMIEGDEVWVLPGAGAAFVLRRADGANCFHLIGEAYLHGAMNGEAVKGLENELRDISLV